jgi:O-antigen biosynthesis protein
VRAAGEMALQPEHYVRYAWAATLVDGARVLDAGCGRGRGTAELAVNADEAVGLDSSVAAIADARRDHGKRARFHEGDMRDLPFGDDEFDAVVCFEAIAHVTETELVLEEMRRVLRPAGVLLISSPNRGVYPHGNPLHLRELDSNELEELLLARFANVVVHRQQTYFASLLGSSTALEHDDSKTAVDAEVVKLTGGPPGSELHSVAVATDGPLPPAPGAIALGEDVDYESQRRRLAEWQRRAIEAEAAELVVRRELALLRESLA